MQNQPNQTNHTKQDDKARAADKARNEKVNTDKGSKHSGNCGC